MLSMMENILNVRVEIRTAKNIVWKEAIKSILQNKIRNTEQFW